MVLLLHFKLPQLSISLVVWELEQRPNLHVISTTFLLAIKLFIDKPTVKCFRGFFKLEVAAKTVS